MGRCWRVAGASLVLVACATSHSYDPADRNDAGIATAEDAGRAPGSRPRFVDVFAAGSQTCALTDRGEGVCWGLHHVGLAPVGRACEFVDGSFDCWTFGGSDEPDAGLLDAPSDTLVGIAMDRNRVIGLDETGAAATWTGGGLTEAEQQGLRGASYRSFALGLFVFYAFQTDGRVRELDQPDSDWKPMPDSAFEKVVAASASGCGLKADHSIECWGSAWSDLIIDGPFPDVAAPAGEFADLAATDGGPYCGLRPDGSVECWSGERVEPRYVPDSCQGDVCEVLGGHPGPFVRLTVGARHGCGLKADGEVACWGLGKRDDDCVASSTHGYEWHSVEGWQCGQAQPPPGKFTRIAAGWFHTCGVRSNGEIECWGAGKTRGACPDGDHAYVDQCGQSLPP